MEELYFFFILAFIAEVLGTVGGFGSSVLFVPIATYFFEFHMVLGLTALFHVSSNLTKIAMFRKGLDKRLLLQIGLPAVIFVIMGAWLSKFLKTQFLELILSLFLIVLSVILLIFRKIKIKTNRFNTIGGGVLSGFVAGLIGTGGAIRGITLASFGLKTDVFIATSAFIDLGVDASRSVVYTLNGYVNREVLILIPVLLVISIIGTYCGKLILKKISEELFKTIVLSLVLLTGLTTLLTALL